MNPSNPFDKPATTLNWSKTDPEQRLGFSGGRYTSVNIYFTLVAGLLLTTAFYLIVIFGLRQVESAKFFCDMFTERGIIPYPTMLFFFWALAILYIKSRTLLPRDQQMAEEDAEEDDPRFELIRQLIEYKKFKEAAARLRDHEAMQQNLFARVPATPDLPPAENLLVEEVGIFDLIHAFQKILKRLDSKKEDLREIFAENFTVSEKIDHVLRVARPGVPLRFEELFADAASRTEIVVTFLAMLELIRLKQLRVRQEGHFGEIWIDRVTDAQPLFS